MHFTGPEKDKLTTFSRHQSARFDGDCVVKTPDSHVPSMPLLESVLPEISKVARLVVSSLNKKEAAVISVSSVKKKKNAHDS